MAPHPEQEESKKCILKTITLGDEVREDEDDEDDFAETLEQLKRLQDEVEDRKEAAGRRSGIALSRDKARDDTGRF